MTFDITRGGISDHGQLSGLADDDHNYGLVGSGSYTGNNTANRAIAHGMGKAPVLVLFRIGYATLRIGEPGYIDYAPAVSVLAVTTWDSTNFYVGNASYYDRSANATGSTYFWVAFA